MLGGFIVLCFCGLSFTLSAQGIDFVKQLTTETGWISDGGHLFWTTSGGREWKDITPSQAAHGKNISAVFFLDTRRGRILLSQYNNDRDTTYFWLCSTEDAGTSWSVRPVIIPELYGPPQPAILTSNAALWFWDSQRGLVALDGGGFFVTSDQGNTWHETAAPAFGFLLFTTPNDGWVRGESARLDYGGQLFVTHDGAKSWQQVLLRGMPNPEEAYVAYGLPMIVDKRHGFVAAEYHLGENRWVTAYSTGDGGHTWRRMKKLSCGEQAIFTVIGTTLSIAKLGRGHRLNLGSVAAGCEPQGGGLIGPGIETLESVRFIDSLHGWALASGQLFSTSDGGATWTNIMPVVLRRDVTELKIKSGDDQ